MRRALLAAVLALLAIPASAAAGQPAGSGIGGVRLNKIGEFSDPVFTAGAPAYPKLLFVVERAGVIRVVRSGSTLRRPFLNISGMVESGFIERGLLSVAFPPDYRSSRRFYVYYTDLDGNIQVDEFLRSRTDPTRALSSSRRAVLTIPHPGAPNHNGGQLVFHGDDLLIGSGDGGLSGDPGNNSQSLDSLLGKMLRIDPRISKSGRPYRVPRTNPFVGLPGRDEIFSYGLRNPFRFSIEQVRKGPDRILIADVGQNRYEEIDYETFPASRGANFGWDAFEGFEPYDCGDPVCPNDGTVDPGGTLSPILAYSHAEGCSVTGGYVVRDPSLATLRGRYIYADFCRGELRSFIPKLPSAVDDRALGVDVAHVSSFGEAPDGRLYVCSLDGVVYRLVRG